MPRFLRPTNRERKLAAAADQHVPIEDWKLFDIKDISSPARLQKLKELFFNHFRIRLYNGNWISFSTRDHLQPIWRYYINHEYPPLEQMIPYANLELEKLKKENSQSIQATAEGKAAAVATEAEVATEANAATEAEVAAEAKETDSIKAAAAEAKAAAIARNIWQNELTIRVLDL